jgi:hypothetical protein
MWWLLRFGVWLVGALVALVIVEIIFIAIIF